jgi:4-hydroxybenzoate polyprenyltransferase
MRRTLLRLVTAMQLTRLTMAYGAIADVWLVILLTRADPAMADRPVSQLPIALALAAGLAVAVGLFTFGATLNDVLDARIDRGFRRDRPIPEGRISPQQAIIVANTCLAAAVLAAFAFGPGGVALAAMTALGIVFYMAAARFLPAAGFITFGLVHAATMVIPNVVFSFTPPIWLSMTHATAVILIVHRLADKRPRVSGPVATVTLVGWAAWSATILAWGWTHGTWWRDGDASPWPGLLWVIAAVVGFAVTVRAKVRGSAGEIAAEKVLRYGAMWQSLYAVAWLASRELWPQALMLGGVAAGGFVAMTLTKELVTAVQRPPEYRTG